MQQPSEWGRKKLEDSCLENHPSGNNTNEAMETVSARMEPYPGNERVLASFLQGLGFRVFRIDGTFMVQATRDLWQQVFDGVDPTSREVVVPPDLADLVTRVVLLRSYSEPDISLPSDSSGQFES